MGYMFLLPAHYVLVQQHHALPPILLYVVLQLYAVLSVVIYCTKSVIDVAAGEYEPILFAMGYDFLENLFLLCHFYLILII